MSNPKLKLQGFLISLLIVQVLAFIYFNKPIQALHENPSNHCGNGQCQASQEETCSSCPADCGSCQAPTNTPAPQPTSTPSPQPTSTPVPQPTPTSTQPTPTPTAVVSCGNGVCQDSIGESCSACAADCGACSSTSTSTSSTATSSSTTSPTPAPEVVPPTVSIDPIVDEIGENQVLTITGSVQPGSLSTARVEVTFDDGVTWFLAKLTGRNFQLTRQGLDDGNYVIRARAIDSSGTISQSSSQTLTVDTFPPIIGGSFVALGPQILTPEADSEIDVVSGSKLVFTTSMLGGVIKASANIKDTSFELNAVKGTNLWVGEIGFESEGKHEVRVLAEDGAGNRAQRSVGTFMVHAYGLLHKKGSKEPVKNANVRAHFFDDDTSSWIPWEGESYLQANPLKISEKYGLMLPPGKYFLQADAPGFRTVQSELFTLKRTSPINIDLAFRTGGFPLIPVSQKAPVFSTEKTTSLGVEREVPRIQLPTVTGQNISTSSFGNQKLLLSFVATWSPQAVEQMSLLNRSVSQLNQDQKVLVVVLQETAGVAETFMRRGKYNLQYVIDERGESAADFGVSMLPYNVFVDSKGVIKETYSGVLSSELLIQKLDRLN